jgi:predicted enzyme related to lactoylglutathione lyase
LTRRRDLFNAEIQFPAKITGKLFKSQRIGSVKTMINVGRMTLLVRDYEEAIDFYEQTLGFEVFVDIDAGEQRYVHVRLRTQPDFGLWLMRADTEQARARVGEQTAGQPCAVIYTSNLYADFQWLSARGVEFNRAPREETGAVFAHFLDLYGNEFVLVEMLPT